MTNHSEAVGKAIDYPEGIDVVRLKSRLRGHTDPGPTLVAENVLVHLPDGTYIVSKEPLVVEGPSNKMLSVREVFDVMDTFVSPALGVPRQVIQSIRNGTERWAILLTVLSTTSRY